ncbi:MAG: transposase, partial [Christensenellaceae bacterium]|jgi:hypothetical protein|nr:transposase [Christensenellaceae bacterium]
MEFLEANKDKIGVFYFPSYSTELNTEELLNNVLKQNMQSRESLRTAKEILHKATEFMLHVSSQLIRNLFKHPKLSYIGFTDI